MARYDVFLPIKYPKNFPYKSWRDYAIHHYSNDDVKTGLGYSAIVGLMNIDDPVIYKCLESEELLDWNDLWHLAPV